MKPLRGILGSAEIENIDTVGCLNAHLRQRLNEGQKGVEDATDLLHGEG